MKLRALLGALAFVVAIGAPASTFAQMPMYTLNDAHHVSGRVDSFDGKWALVVRHRHVQLHQGTVINPTGATLRPGQWVSVRGTWVQGQFQADVINVRMR